MNCKLCEKIWKSKDEYRESERYPWDERIVITMKEGQPWLYVPCGDTWYSDTVLQINYCPYCGRKLTEESNNE